MTTCVLFAIGPEVPEHRGYTLNEAGVCAALLRSKGHEAKIYVQDRDILSLDRLFNQIVKYRPHLVSVPLMWLSPTHFDWAEALSKRWHTLAHRPLLAAQGKTATLYRYEMLSQFSGLDLVVVGEAEHTILALAERIGASCPWHDVEGIAFRYKGQVTLSPCRAPITNLDELPFSSRDGLEDQPFPYVPVIVTSRGCYGQCTFCPYVSYYPSGWRARSAQNVVSELAELVARYNSRVVYFADNNFLGGGTESKVRARQIADGIIAQGLKLRLYIECRANDVEEELFRHLAKAGLRRVLLGIESGAQSTLDRFHKGTTVEMNRKALALLRRLRINVQPGFIMFDGLMSLAELKANVAFLEEESLWLEPRFLFSYLHPYPHTAAYDELQQADLLTRNGLSPLYRFRDPQVAAVKLYVDAYTRQMWSGQNAMLRAETKNPIALHKLSLTVLSQAIKWAEAGEIGPNSPDDELRARVSLVLQKHDGNIFHATGRDQGSP